MEIIWKDPDIEPTPYGENVIIRLKIGKMNY